MGARTDSWNHFRRLVHEEVIKAARERKKSPRNDQNQLSNEKSSQDGPKGPFCDYAEEVPESSHPKDSFMQRLFNILLSPDPWRLTVGLLMIFLYLCIGAGAGWIDIPGLPAYASELAVKDLRVDAIEKDIPEAVRNWCLGNTAQSKVLYVKQINRLRTTYWQLTGYRFSPDPLTCNDVGVREVPVEDDAR